MLCSLLKLKSMKNFRMFDLDKKVNDEKGDVLFLDLKDFKFSRVMIMDGLFEIFKIGI